MRILTALRATLTPAFAVACLALAVGLSGTAYAAVKVGATDIKRDAVRAKHIKAGAVRADEVRDGSLTGLDIQDGSLSGADLQDRTVGRDDLAPSARGITDAELVWRTSSATGSEPSKSVTAQCPDGKVAISGGAIINGSDNNVYITESSPPSGAAGPLQQGWFILAQEEEGTDGGNWDIRGFAVCVSLG
ncbi:hypothetical protein [Nocardioides humi]|uniref:Uncharacterized protein n=1 Tax=Nocardioides humi TaxID=449461 RepID=A0ABN2ALN9_9ACTN|nr:hypothetical protein [Nocardioides humi]